MSGVLRKRATDNVDTDADQKLLTSEVKKLKSDNIIPDSDKENVGQVDTLPNGLHNESNTCYLNSLIQILFHLLPFRQLVFHLTNHTQSQKLTVLEALQWLFLDILEGGEGEIISTQRLTKAFGWTSINRGIQQDVNEFMQMLFGHLEKELTSEGFQQLSSVLKGTLERSVKCEEVGYESKKLEQVRGLSLTTTSFTSIEKSLADMFNSEKVEMKIDDYGKQMVDLQASWVDFPKVLMLTLNRLKYDPVEQDVVKVTDYFEYSERLQLGAHVYRLHSTVVHEGTATCGHYYCYVDPVCSNKWYMFNDDKVSHSSQQSAIKVNYGKCSEPASPTAYLLTYIRDDCTEFFSPVATCVPDKLRERVQAIRQAERVRLQRIQTAHLYTTISLVTWPYLSGHSGYGLCDRVGLDNLHKSGEGTPAKGLANLRVLKESSVQQVLAQHDSSLTQSNVRLWSFNERQAYDGWFTLRPDQLIKDWRSTIATVSKQRCPYYIYVETIGADFHPMSMAENELSVFVKVYGSDLSLQKEKLRLQHHLVVSIELPFDEFKSKVLQLSDIDTEKYDALIYQECSSMSTELLSGEEGESPLSHSLNPPIRHSTILILEVIEKHSTPQAQLSEYMRKLGHTVTVTWYNKSQSYLPSNVDGEFTLQLFMDMEVCDVIDELANHLKCGKRCLIVYEAKRDQGYPLPVSDHSYTSQSKGCLLVLIRRQVQQSALWRHSASLYYKQLPMSIEEMERRYSLTCTYISHDLTSHSLTLHPLKLTDEEGNTPSTVSDLFQLADTEISRLTDKQTSEPLRLLAVRSKKISQVYNDDHPISSILQEELRLEHVCEAEEEAEMDFTEVLASVTVECAYLWRRNVPATPFLLVVSRSDTGTAIVEKINERLNVQPLWKNKIEHRLIIPGEPSRPLPEGKLSVKDWGNLARDDDTGSFEGCNYIKVVDAPRPE